MQTRLRSWMTDYKWAAQTQTSYQTKTLYLFLYLFIRSSKRDSCCYCDRYFAALAKLFSVVLVFAPSSFALDTNFINTQLHKTTDVSDKNVQDCNVCALFFFVY